MNKKAHHNNLPPLLPAFSPEMQLLLCCARTEMIEPFHGHINGLVVNGIDWPRVLSLSASHGMVSLLHKHLSGANYPNIPETFLTQLSQKNRGVRARQLFLTARMLKTSRLLNDAHIPHLHYKGIVLDHLLYGGQMLRVTSDMDILVRKEDVMFIKEILSGEGYEPVYVEHEHQEEIVLENYKDYGFIHSKNHHMIEVHWSLTEDYFGKNYTFAELVDAQQQVLVNGQPQYTFNNENLFQTLTLHGAKHRFESLKWLVDLGQFISNNPEHDWPLQHQQARSNGTETIFLFTLDLCNRLLGINTEHLSMATKPTKQAIRLSEEVCRLLTDNHNSDQLYPQISFHVRMLDSPWAKLRYIWGLAFGLKHDDVDSGHLPWYLTPYSYISRANRLIRRRGLGPLMGTLGRMIRAMQE